MATISRKELYKKVWETPITRLAREYGLSDVGFAKICKKYNIPRPPRGYWARKAAGYKVKRLPLPQGDDITIAITPNPYSRNSSKSRDLASRISGLKNKDDSHVGQTWCEMVSQRPLGNRRSSSFIAENETRLHTRVHLDYVKI